MERGVRSLVLSTLMLIACWTTGNAQPEVIKDIPNNSTNFVTIGTLTYFASGNNLWRTDGTSAGTIQIKPGLSTEPFAFKQFKNYALFLTGRDHPVTSDEPTTQLWRTDGTPGGTVQLMVKDHITLAFATPNYFFFEAEDAATGRELYRTDGTAEGTIMLKDIWPGSTSSLRGGSGILGNLYMFSASDPVHGTELWKSDGSREGTVMVEDINPGAGHGIAGNSNTFVYNNLYYFRGMTSGHGAEPWVSDGTAQGTRLLKDTKPGPESFGSLQYGIGNNGYLYFLAIENFKDGPGALWKTAGTDASTSFIKVIEKERMEGAIHDYHSFLVYQDKVYFWDRTDFFTDHLWVTDGTAGGTHTFFQVTDIDGLISFFTVVNNHMVFTGESSGAPLGFYRSDGTSGGTVIFTHFRARAIGTFPRDVTKVEELVFYGDHDGFTDQGGHPTSAEDYYHLFQTNAFTTQSMRTLWGINTIGTDNITDLNGNVIFTTQNDQFGSSDLQKRLWRYDPSDTPPPTAKFTLVNAHTDEDVKRLLDGASIKKPYQIPLNIRFDPKQPAGSVVFSLNGRPVRTETAAPYSLAGDVNGDYAPWQGGVPGTYTLTATPYSEAGGRGTPGESLTITFTIECSSADEDCTETGSIRQEIWFNAAGNSVSDVPIESEPDDVRHIGLFEGPTNDGTNYGARYRGYVVPPTTGNYTFWISSNDHSELWLSTDDQVENRRKIASVTGATNSREWSKYASQKSAPVTLTAGKKYYIEALHKQGAGTVNMAVGWQLPNGTFERPIPGNRLAPFMPYQNAYPTIEITNPTAGDSVAAPADILIEATASDGDEQDITMVEFAARLNGGDLTKIGEDATEPYSFLWEDVDAGHYDLYALGKDSEGNTLASTFIHVIVYQEEGECSASGTITRDYWSGISGDRVSNIPVNSQPTSTNELTIFEAPSNIGDNYGTRIRGYICPPASGGYRFWIASNDFSELWLSTDADPANKVRIAFVNGATNPRQWDKFTSQVSATIALTKGQQYYIEALHKEGVGTDHIAVGWQLPDGVMERPIPGSRLSPFDASGSFARSQTGNTDESLYSQIGIYPNPAARDVGELNIAGYEGINEPVATQIQIIKMTGEVVFSEEILCGGDCSTYLIKVHEQLVPGLYMVNMKTNGVRHSRRLLVE